METKTRLPRPNRPGEELLPQALVASAILRGLRECSHEDKQPSQELARLMLMLLLYVQPQPTSFSYLDDEIGLERYQLSRLCDRMHAEGMLVRGNDPNDMRQRRVSLLPAGRSIVEALVAPMRRLTG